MPTTTLIRPHYASLFCCIGPACEDTCCTGWRVDIDRPTFDKYQAIPAGRLRSSIAEHVVRIAPVEPDTSGSAAHEPFASIRMSATHRCPFHNADRLCQIQVERGADYLSPTCASFPRTTLRIDQLEDTTLTLSCPEAARLVLLHPNLLDPGPEAVREFAWDAAAVGCQPIKAFFWPLRELCVSIVRNRAYPLWQRLFLLGSLARRLDSVKDEMLEDPHSHRIADLLRDFSEAVTSNRLHASIESIPADLPLQLDIVLNLIDLCAEAAPHQPRLQPCLDAFAAGVGLNGDLASRTARYAEAHREHYAPFFARHARILENLVLHQVLRSLFPVGKSLVNIEIQPQPAREFAALAIEFALLKGALIGVAGFHKSAFSTGHVIETIQILSKSFEHHPSFAAQSQRMLAERGLDSARGVSLLLRN